MIHRRLFRYVPPRPPNFNVVLVLMFFGSVLALAINIEIWGVGGLANRRRCCLIDTANRPCTPTLSKKYNASKHFSRFRIALSASLAQACCNDSDTPGVDGARGGTSRLSDSRITLDLLAWFFHLAPSKL